MKKRFEFDPAYYKNSGNNSYLNINKFIIKLLGTILFNHNVFLKKVTVFLK